MARSSGCAFWTARRRAGSASSSEARRLHCSAGRTNSIRNRAPNGAMFDMTTAAGYIGKGLKLVLPAPAYWRALAWRMGYFDPEMRLLPDLCDRSKISIDVGASNGSYAIHML